MALTSPDFIGYRFSQSRIEHIDPRLGCRRDKSQLCGYTYVCNNGFHTTGPTMRGQSNAYVLYIEDACSAQSLVLEALERPHSCESTPSGVALLNIRRIADINPTGWFAGGAYQFNRMFGKHWLATGRPLHRCSINQGVMSKTRMAASIC